MRKGYRKQTHHIIPRSRGGGNELENRIIVNGEKHRLYHMLFENKTPEEIIDYLNRDFWKRNYDIIINEK